MLEYPHSEGCSITGGYVYRGKAIPELAGSYFYSDFCTAILRSFRLRNGKVADAWDWKTALDPDSKIAQVTAFGEDQDGEIYMVSQEGTIFKLVHAEKRQRPSRPPSPEHDRAPRAIPRIPADRDRPLNGCKKGSGRAHDRLFARGPDWCGGRAAGHDGAGGDGLGGAAAGRCTSASPG